MAPVVPVQYFLQKATQLHGSWLVPHSFSQTHHKWCPEQKCDCLHCSTVLGWRTAPGEQSALQSPYQYQQVQWQDSFLRAPMSPALSWIWQLPPQLSAQPKGGKCSHKMWHWMRSYTKWFIVLIMVYSTLLTRGQGQDSQSLGKCYATASDVTMATNLWLGFFFQKIENPFLKWKRITFVTINFIYLFF